MFRMQNVQDVLLIILINMSFLKRYLIGVAISTGLVILLLFCCLLLAAALTESIDPFVTAWGVVDVIERSEIVTLVVSILMISFVNMPKSEDNPRSSSEDMYNSIK